MKKSTMKKMGSMMLACLMVVSTFATLSTVSYAESNSYKTKIHETFLELDPEELAALTADPTTYDISVFIEFASSAEELAALYSDDPTERRENGKNYHSNKNKKLKEALELENAYVSNLAPFAEIQYDSLEEYEASRKQVHSIAKSKDVKDIDVSITNLRGENLAIDGVTSVESSSEETTRDEYATHLTYHLSEVFANVGIEDDTYTGDGVTIGVIEVDLPDTTSHIPADQYYAYGDSIVDDDVAALHARLVTSLVGGYYGVAKDATIYCASTTDLGFLGAVDTLVDEEYLQLINMSLGVSGWAGYYDNMAAYLDYLSYTYSCLFVKSAGNQGAYPSPALTSPACSANAITVGAMNKGFRVSYFSSYMHFVDGINKPDLVAPGENIIFHPNVYNPEYYDGFINSGTSFAAPLVTGIAARLMEEFPNLTAVKLKAILLQSCEKVYYQTDEHDVYAGYGSVNYRNARAIAAAGQYALYTKTPATTDGSVLGYRSITIPAHGQLHLYLTAQNPGVHSDTPNFQPTTFVDSSDFQIGININGTVYYYEDHVVVTNPTDEAITIVFLAFMMEDRWSTEYEWAAMAYDIVILPPQKAEEAAESELHWQN